MRIETNCTSNWSRINVSFVQNKIKLLGTNWIHILSDYEDRNMTRGVLMIRACESDSCARLLLKLGILPNHFPQYVSLKTSGVG